MLRDTAPGRHQPVIDRDYSAGHVVGQIRREEFDQLGAIPDRPEPPKCDQFEARSRLLWLLPGIIVAIIRPVVITAGAMQFTVIPNGPEILARYRV